MEIYRGISIKKYIIFNIQIVFTYMRIYREISIIKKDIIFEIQSVFPCVRMSTKGYYNAINQNYL